VHAHCGEDGRRGEEQRATASCGAHERDPRPDAVLVAEQRHGAHRCEAAGERERGAAGQHAELGCRQRPGAAPAERAQKRQRPGDERDLRRDDGRDGCQSCEEGRARVQIGPAERVCGDERDRVRDSRNAERAENRKRGATAPARPELVGELARDRPRVAEVSVGIARAMVTKLGDDSPPQPATDADGAELVPELVDHWSTASTAVANARHSSRRSPSSRLPLRVSR
jgi:hypothetical protein